LRTADLKELISQATSDLFECTTPEDLIRELEKFTHGLGFTVVSYQLIHPIGWGEFEGPIVLFSKGYSEEQLGSYNNSKLYKNDPLFKFATGTGQVFWWKDIAQITKLTPEQIRFMDAFVKSGLDDGYSVPTFGPNGRNGYFGIGRGRSDRFETKQLGQILQLYCQTLHLRYCGLTHEQNKEVALSSKEKEVMTHVVRGLSTNQIADMLGVTSNTVNTHLKRVYAKMKVQDRVSATLRFLASGQMYE